MPTHKILTDLDVGGKVTTTEIESASTILLDAAADITIDAGGQDIILSDDATIFGTLSNSSGFQIRSRVNDADLLLRGVDNSTEFTALQLDMSDAGTAIFSHDIKMPSAGVINFNSGDMTITHSSNKLSISGGTTSINALELGQTDHVIEDGSNILDENDNTMMSFASGVANITGNAATATTLATARNIGGVSFNGSSAINLPGVNTSGNQDTSGNAATATALTSGNKTIAGILDITDTTDSSNATGDTGALRCEGGASIAKKLYAGSTITGSADVIAYSDQKLKENVKTLDGKKVLEMRGVSFDRVDTGKASSGVIAQEMEKVAPELVIDDGKYKGVAYGNIVGYLIEAIKDQQKQIDELKEICRGCSK
tara:strand:- start:200 stop:1309 length:1110 start_codon:yes stop_codon:yes gene_type:complete